MHRLKLSSLRVCLEVMRRGKISEAARALNMTQSAVSKNLKLVESQLGTPLFRRLNDGVVPFDHARAFLFRVAEGVGTIDTAFAELAEVEGRGSLRIAAPPIIAQRFLIPHIGDLHALHPGLELLFRVRTPVTRRNADTDAEIFFSDGTAVAPEAQWLAGDCLWVVAHPALVPADLPMASVSGYPLLQHVKVERAWSGVAERAGLKLDHARFHHYEQYGLIIDAVLQKQGIAIIPRFLISDTVAAGQLRRIGDDMVFPGMGYYYLLIRREKTASSGKFFGWLQYTLRQSDMQ